MKFDYAIFIQARLGSTRFPKKVLQQLAGKRVLDHVIDTCKSTGIKTLLLTPGAEKDFFSKEFNIDVFGGSETDVLSRFVECSEKFNVENIIRITSDCPCLPASHIIAVVEEHKKNSDNFVSNVSYEEGTYKSLTNISDGFDVEVFSSKILKLANDSATDQKDREHVTSWMRRNCAVYTPPMHLYVEGKFSFDTEQDLGRLERNFEILRSLKTWTKNS